MKKIEYLCNVCRFTIENNKGYGMYWTGSYRIEDLKIVHISKSENHICLNCFEKTRSVKVDNELLITQV